MVRGIVIYQFERKMEKLGDNYDYLSLRRHKRFIETWQLRLWGLINCRLGKSCEIRKLIIQLF